MSSPLTLFPILVLGIIAGGTISGSLVSVSVSGSSVYVATSSGYLVRLSPYSPVNTIAYVGNVSSIYSYQGKLYVLKGDLLYLLHEHSLKLISKISEFHPPYYVKNGSLYLINGSFLAKGQKYLFHGVFAISFNNFSFTLFINGKTEMVGKILKIPRDFYYFSKSLFLLYPSKIYELKNGSISEIAYVPKALSIYYVNSSYVFIKSYEYNGAWNITVLKVVSLKSHKIVKVLPCSWFSFPYIMSEKKILNLISGKILAEDVIKVDYNGEVLVCLHQNSTLEIFEKNGTRYWQDLPEMPAVIRAVGRYAFAYFLIIAHAKGYVAMYAPSAKEEKKEHKATLKVPISFLSAFLFIATLAGLAALGYYVFRK